MHSKPKELSTSELYNKQLVNIYHDTVLTTKTNNFIVEEGIDHELITSLIEKIHTSSAYDGAILVFLPGFEDIIEVSNMIGVRLRNNDFTLFLLHSSMKTEDQKNVFKQVFNRRKIILSTNIAESSITINDVVYVIDSGREKQKSYDAISHSSSLQVQWISKASAKQRRGRAGRLRNGVVFRVYSKDRYNSMLETTIPELLRTSLTEICLQTKLIIGDAMTIETFLGKCIATPSIPSIRQSIKLLQCLGALDKNESLTLLGSHLAEMPVDARFAKMLVYASALKCLNPVLNIVSILSMGDQIFILPTKPADRFRCHEVRRRFGGDSLSDHFVMLKIFQDFINLKGNERRFCEENFISNVALERAKGIRGQISSYLQKSGLLKGDDNRNSDKWSLVKACLCCGLYPNIARIDRSKKMMYSDIDRKLVFHMSSNLCVKNERSMDYVKFFPSDWCIFEEKNRIGRTSMIRCNTLVNSFSVSLAAGSSLTAEIITSIGDWSEEEDNSEPQLMIKLDNLVTFEMENEDGKLLMDLRLQLDEFIFRFLTMRDFRYEKEDDLLISTIACLVDIEETKSGFIKMNLKNDEQQFRSNLRRNNNKAPNHFINFSETSRNQGWSRHQQSSNFAPPQQQTSDFVPPQQSRYVPPHKRPNPQKFFVLKINNEAKINEWARSSLINLDQLQLNQWFMNRICHPSVVKRFDTQFFQAFTFIFFFSDEITNIHLLLFHENFYISWIR